MTTILEDLFDIDSPFDLVFNLYTLIQDLSGGIFIYVFLVLVFLSSWLISKKVILPAVLFSAVGGLMMIIAPWELKGIAMLMFIFGMAGIVYTWFKE